VTFEPGAPREALETLTSTEHAVLRDVPVAFEPAAQTYEPTAVTDGPFVTTRPSIPPTS